MANSFPDSETVREQKALPAELQAIYQRLSHDGAVWQAASAERLASLAQSLVDDIERMASEGSLAASTSDATGTTPPAAGIHAPSPAFRRRREWIAGAFAVVAAVVVVGLLALVFQGALTGRGPNRVTSQNPGEWQILDKLTLRRTSIGQAAPIIAPTNTQVVYDVTNMVTGSAETSKVVTYASLRRTEDGGETWTALALPLPVVDITSIDIVVSPLRAQTVFMTLWDRSSATCDPQTSVVGEGCERGYVSTDGGDTWQAQALPVRGLLNTRKAIVAQDARLYASNLCEDDTCAHVLMSADGGLAWQVVDEQITASQQHICDLMATASGQTVYVVGSQVACVQSSATKSLWRSDDAGAHWTRLGPLLPTSQPGNFEVAFGGPLLTAPGTGHRDLLFLNMPYLNADTSPSFLYSVDRGATWRSTPPVPVARTMLFAYPEIPIIGASTVLSNGALFYIPLYPYEYQTPYVWTPGSSAWQRLPAFPAATEILGTGEIIVTPGANGHDVITKVLGVNNNPAVHGDTNPVAYYVVRYQM